MMLDKYGVKRPTSKPKKKRIPRTIFERERLEEKKELIQKIAQTTNKIDRAELIRELRLGL